MSCNEPFFDAERIAVHETWAKDLIDGYYPCATFYSYTASTRNYSYIENNTIYVKCGDGLFDTFDKTIECFRILKNLDITYDYIIRTNTSTYLNIPILLSNIYNTISLCPNIDFDGFINYSNDDYLNVNNNSYSMILSCGCYMMLSYNFINQILKIVDDKSLRQQFSNYLKLCGENTICKTDGGFHLIDDYGISILHMLINNNLFDNYHHKIIRNYKYDIYSFCDDRMSFINDDCITAVSFPIIRCRMNDEYRKLYEIPKIYNYHNHFMSYRNEIIKMSF